MTESERRVVTLGDGGVELEVFLGGEASSRSVVCAAHPADTFGPGTVELLAEASGARVVCANPGPNGVDAAVSPSDLSLELMVDRLDEARRRLGIGRWAFWGMSGGGWLAEIYARRYPDALDGIVLESVCACFRERLADPACVLSPFFPGWRDRLRAAGLLQEDSHRGASPAGDTTWVDVEGVGRVWRRSGGPALLVSPGPLEPVMQALIPRFWDFDARPWLGELHTPALVVCGTGDPVVPVRHARAVHEALESSTFVEIAGAGHVPTAERRPEVAEAVQRFMADNIS